MWELREPPGNKRTLWWLTKRQHLRVAFVLVCRPRWATDCVPVCTRRRRDAGNVIPVTDTNGFDCMTSREWLTARSTNTIRWMARPATMAVLQRSFCQGRRWLSSLALHQPPTELPEQAFLRGREGWSWCGWRERKRETQRYTIMNMPRFGQRNAKACTGTGGRNTLASPITDGLQVLGCCWMLAKADSTVVFRPLSAKSPTPRLVRPLVPCKLP
ncbi:hypothetical protein QBC47DRAFT_82679 [Echria macrotheca]|uniref:Uncharacterized protein n=1 Tax=Echria macrotheca TaxID=438768 RepID=A0AAJ0B6V5_9PEZI|nr:hypothetical protein QBC47DRAFT_82679 [Echria macrotheca]